MLFKFLYIFVLFILSYYHLLLVFRFGPEDWPSKTIKEP